MEPKKQCWDIIKRYYPNYEGKGAPFRTLLEGYLRSEHILIDVGCGRGKETPCDYKARVRRSIGVDLSEEIRKNTKVQDRIVGDGANIPLATGSADVVVCQELLEHLETPEKVFKEAARILKRQGIFIIMTPNLMGWRSLVSRLTPYGFHKVMNRRLYGIDPDDVFPTYYRANTRKKIERLLNGEGLEIEKWIWFEPTPRTLAFSRLLVYLEIMYTKTLRKYRVLSFLRETIIVCARKR